MLPPLVVRSRLSDSRHIELDEPITNITGVVKVTVRSAGAIEESCPEDIVDFINSLPPGTRTKEDIDKQIKQERDSWGDR